MKSLASRVALGTGAGSGVRRAIALAYARQKQLIAQHPIGRLAEPCEFSALVFWLGLPATSFVTGGYFPVDGGYLAR